MTTPNKLVVLTVEELEGMAYEMLESKSFTVRAIPLDTLISRASSVDVGKIKEKLDSQSWWELKENKENEMGNVWLIRTDSVSQAIASLIESKGILREKP